MRSVAKIFDLPQAAPAEDDAPALKLGGETVTYGQLRANVRRYARFLQQRGIRPGDRVALSLPNSCEFIYSYLGASRAGAVVVPLNLMLSLEEIAYILRDCQAHSLIVHPAISAKLDISAFSSLGLKNLTVLDGDTLDQIASLPGEEDGSEPPASFPALPSFPRFPGKPPRPTILADNSPAAILYTSGTTGRPKGAVLSHKNLLANVRQMDDASDLGPEENFLCALPMFHSFGWTVCALLPLYLGSAITILDSFRPKDALRTLVEEGISVFCGVPAMFAVLARAAERPLPLPHLKFAISGGAPLPAPVIHAFEGKFGGTLLEGYGLSEASPVVAMNPIGGVRKIGSVGLPLPGVRVRVVDEQRRDVPQGEIGEIAVRGDNVMLGYYNLPEETSHTLAEGWLLTGDLGQLDEDGYLYVVDRKKDLIIVSGFNVYPREIEDTLLTHPGVQDAAVLGIPDPLKGEAVKAFIIPKEGEHLERADILDFLRPKLARYKLPQVIEFVDSLPRSPSGKVLKRLLR